MMKGIFSTKEFERMTIDYFENEYLLIYCKNWYVNDGEYMMMNDLEKTFYYKDEKSDFLIFLLYKDIVFEFKGLHKEDMTKTSAVYVLSSMLNSMLVGTCKILIMLKKDKRLKKRLEYIASKHKASWGEVKEGQNRNFMNKKHSKRNPIESRLRHEVFKRDNYRCKECGATNKETTLHCDHILPVSQGGTDELDNLQTLCEACNLAKSNKCFTAGKKDQSTLGGDTS